MFKDILNVTKVVLLFYILIAHLWAVESFHKLKMEVRHPQRVTAITKYTIASYGTIKLVDKDCKELEPEVTVYIDDWSIGGLVP